MNNEEKIKKQMLDVLGLDDSSNLVEIENRLKLAIRDPKTDARKWNILFRGATLFGIDLSSEVKKAEQEENLKELYQKKGPTIFTLLATNLGVSEEEVKTYSYEDIINIAERIVSTSKLSVKDYNIMLRGVSTIERYLNVNSETNNIGTEDNSINNNKK